MEILSHLLTFFTEYGYIAVFCVLVACGFGIPIPEDITLVAGGIICALSRGTPYELNVQTMIIVTLSGVLLGDGVMFSLGRYLGPSVTRVPGLKHVITPQNYAKIQEKAKHYGDKVLFIARFLPGLRAPIFIISGISHKVSLLKFILMDGTAALISVPVWVYMGYLFAYDIDYVISVVKKSEVLILSIVAIILVLIISINFIKRRKK
ncbi:MAG: DedA family protein [Burkholderiales bacterium]|nr:DedA family protein [Burkholderiales bacterium]